MNSIRRIAWGTTLLLGLTSTSFAFAQSALAMTGTTGEQTKIPGQTEVTKPLTGTLFFSQGQREKMDRARKSGRVAVGEETTTEDQRSIINGFVKRSDGATSVWVDGKVQVLTSGSLADQIQPLSVGTTLSDARIAVGDSPHKAAEITQRRYVRPKPAAKSKTKIR